MSELDNSFGMHGLYGNQMRKIRSKVIAKIIAQRSFEVPIEFIEMYVTNDVIAELSSYPGIDPMSYNLSEQSIVHNFVSFLKDVVSSDANVNILTPEFVRKISPRVYVLLLSEDSQWKKYLKYSRRNIPKYPSRSQLVWGHYLVYLIRLFISEGLDIPPIVIETAANYKRGLCLKEYFISPARAIGELTTIVRSMDKCLNILPKYPEYLNIYWVRGGLYFPKYIFTIPQSKLIDDLEDLYERNICIQRREHFENNTISLNYLQWKYTPAHTKFILSSNLDLHFKGSPLHLDVAHYTVPDLLENYADDDINLLRVLFQLNIPMNEIHGVFKDEEVYSQLIDRANTTNVPMSDFSLFVHLRGVSTLSGDTQKAFIMRGGSPRSISSAGVSKPYNLCYTKEGIRTILSRSSIDDIVDVIDNDATFRYYLSVYMDDSQLDFLVKRERFTLIEAIAKSAYCEDPQLLSISIALIRSVGMIDAVTSIPISMSLLMKRETSEYDYASLVGCVDQDTLPYIPIYLLSEFILLRYLSYDPERNKYQKINCDKVRLDYVVSKSTLDQIILSKGWVCYIPELSDDMMESYITELAYMEFGNN